MAFLCVFCFCACGKLIKDEIVLFDQPLKETPGGKIKLSELVGDKFKLTPLETTDHSLVGNINKIRKIGEKYYILSDERRIFCFDKDGKYLSTLERLGSGPEEYTHIGDFDVYNVDGKNEIWLCDVEAIKIYNAADLSYIRSMKFPFVVNKFRRINNNRIILMTGQNKKSLSVCNRNGQVIASFLDKEVPFLTFRSVQFVAYNNELLFPLGLSNGLVLYNPEDDVFRRGRYFLKKNLLSVKELLALYKESGIDYLEKLEDTNYIWNIRRKGNKSFIIIHTPQKDFWVTVHADENALTAVMKPEGCIQNDLFDIPDLRFLFSLGIGESDDSILMCIPAEEMNGYKGAKEGDNPCLVEFF